MKTIEKITAKTLLENGLKISYSKVFGGLFPRLTREIQISFIFAVIGFIVVMLSMVQKLTIIIVIALGIFFVSCIFFMCFKVYKKSNWEKFKIPVIHLEDIIKILEIEAKKIKNPKEIELSFESLVLSLNQKNEFFNKIEDEIKSITDESQEEDDLPGLKEVFEKTKDEILDLESEVSGRREIFEPIETEIKQLEILLYGDGVKEVKSLVTPT